MNAVWWQIIAATTAGVLIGVLTNAIPFFIRYLRQPHLKLYLETNDKKTYYTRTISGTTSLGRWVAIWVKNAPLCGQLIARDCHPELIRIEHQTVDGSYEEEIDFVRDRLSWAGMGGEAGRGFIERDIDRDAPLRIALCLVSQGSPTLLQVETRPTAVAAGRKLAFETGTYLATVRLYSANTRWTEKKFLLHHTGDWDQLSISDVKKEMLMKRISLYQVGAIIVCSLAFVSSLVVSILVRNVDWFARSGSILCVAGALLVVRRLLRLGPEVIALRERIIDGGSFVQSEEERKQEEEEDRDWRAAHCGVILTVFGILIWAYGGVILQAFL